MSTTRLALPTLAEEYLRGESLWMSAARLASANLLMVLCSWIALPLPGTPVPLTGQTFGVLLVACLFGPNIGWQAMAFYLLEGLAGLPVFQPYGAPGMAHLIGPTGGYLLAFPLAAALAGWLATRDSRLSGLLSALLAGELVIFASGLAWLARWMHLDFTASVYAGLLPFIPGEIVKMAAVVVAVRGLRFGTSLRR